MVPMRILLALAAGACSAGEWRQLFNHRDMTGWKMVGPGRFVVEDGMLKTEGSIGCRLANL